DERAVIDDEAEEVAREAGGRVEEERLPVAERLLDRLAEHVEEEEVPEQVHPPGVKEHRRHELDGREVSGNESELDDRAARTKRRQEADEVQREERVDHPRVALARTELHLRNDEQGCLAAIAGEPTGLGPRSARM